MTHFSFEQVQEVLLTHINIRREFHGDEHVHAVDLSMRLEASNDLLDKIEPKLREALYCNKAATAGQELLPEVMAVLPNLRFPRLNNQKFVYGKGDRLKGYNLTLDYGLGPEQSNVDLDGCTVTGIRFEVKEGGTVVLDWLVQYAGDKLDSDVRGLLTGLTGEKIHIQLLPEPGMQVVRGKEKAPAAAAAGEGGEGDLLDGDGEEGEVEEGGEAGEGEPEPGSPEAAFLSEARGEGGWAFPNGGGAAA